MFLKKILCMNWYFLFRFPQNVHSIVRKLMMQYFLTEGFEILLFHAIGKFSSTGENLLTLPPVETSSFPPVGISSCTLVFSTGGNSNLLIFPPVGIYTFSTCGNLFNLLIFPPVGIYSIYSFSLRWESTHFPTGGNLLIFPVMHMGIYTFSHRWESTHFPSYGNLHIFPPVHVGIFSFSHRWEFTQCYLDLKMENELQNFKQIVIWI